MARDAAKRFRERVTEGDEIPYDVDETGSGSPIPQYVPLTGQYVRDHASTLHELDSFGAACAAIESADLAGPYLLENGIEVPAEARRRAELAGVVFLARLWMDSTDFSLDDERLRLAINELEANGDADAGEIEVVVPLRGLRMESTRINLATGAIVRADTVDVPAEARASEASGGAGWEPTFLAVATAGHLRSGRRGVGRRRRRHALGSGLPRDGHGASAVQGRRRGTWPARVDPRGLRALAPDLDRIRQAQARRLSPRGDRAR